jgi:hypothetical protein
MYIISLEGELLFMRCRADICLGGSIYCFAHWRTEQRKAAAIVFSGHCLSISVLVVQWINQPKKQVAIQKLKCFLASANFLILLELSNMIFHQSTMKIDNPVMREYQD